jgi:adenylate kinase family enzyme
MTKLIILRGPSGAGKSTIAKKLFEEAKRPTALIEQDYYRFIFKPPGGALNVKTIHEMILQNTLTALRGGYDVILDGILNVHTYGEVLGKMVSEHPQENYFFYFDISLAETLKRHSGRKTRDLFTEKDMRDWYHSNDVTGHDFERIISEQSSAEATFKYIKKVLGG